MTFGGNYGYNGLERPAYYRSSSYVYSEGYSMGTRPILYIK